MIESAALVVEGGHVAWVGPAADAPAADTTYDVGGRAVIPGFVDSHSHLVFAGDRAQEFAARMAGESYSAGGIRTTVAATRAATDEQLTAHVGRLVAEMRRQGTTTVEIKSGYGLSVRDEARSLAVAGQFTDETTFLGAHVVPEGTDVAEYVDLVTGPMLEAAAPYARWIDVFCERGAFDGDQARRILEAGAAAGLLPRLHANQLGPGPGVLLACELGLTAVDHCTYLEDADVDALAASGTIATLLPGVEFSTRQPWPGRPPPARRRGPGGARLRLQPRLLLHQLGAVLPRAGGPRHGDDADRGVARGHRDRCRRARPDDVGAPRPRDARRSRDPRRAQSPPPRVPPRRTPRERDLGRRPPGLRYASGCA